MSLNGLYNTQFPLTLDGTTSLDVSSLTIDGQNITLTGLVPYVGATQTLNMGSQNIQTTHVPVAPNDVVNLDTLTNAVTFVDTSVALTYLNKITSSSQSVAGPVTFSSGLTTSANKDTSLASIVSVASNYLDTTIASASVTVGQYFGTITNALGVYQSTCTNNSPPILVLFPITAGNRYTLSIETLIEDASYDWTLDIYQSADNVTPYPNFNQAVLDSYIFAPASTVFHLTSSTFNATTTGTVVLTISSSNPSGIGTVKWKNMAVYNMGVALTNASMPSQTADRVLVLNTNKQVVASGINTTKLGYLDNVSSDIQTQLNGKLSTSGGTLSGPLTVDASVSVGTRLLGQVDNNPSGNFWIGLRGSGTEAQRLAITIVGADGTGTVSAVSVAKPFYLTDPTVNRVLGIDSQGKVFSTIATITEIGYLSGVTNSIQTQLDSKANTSALASYVLKAGDTMTGNLLVNARIGVNQSSPQWRIHASNTNAWSAGGYTKADGIMALGGKDNNPDYQYLIFPNPSQNDGGVTGMNWWSSDMITGRYKNEYRLAWWKETHAGGLGNAYKEGITLFLTDSGGYTDLDYIKLNGKTDINGQINSNINSLTTPNIKLSNLKNHISGTASEAWLFTGYNGHITIGRNTTRDATTTNLMLGVASTEEAQIISRNTDDSAYKPLSFASSVYSFITSDSADVNKITYDLRGQTGFDGSCYFNLQCQASQYGRTQLILTGRYEGANDAWEFTSARNAIRFRTQSAKDSAYTNRWTIQNYNDALGFLSSSGGNTPRMVMLNNGHVGIGADAPFTKLEVKGAGTLIGAYNPDGGNNYVAMRLMNNAYNGCYWFMNSSERTDDGGVNTATLRNDVGTLRLQAQYERGFRIDNDGCIPTNCGTISSNNPGDTALQGYFGITRNGARNGAGLWTGVDSGNNVWQHSLAPSVSWNGFFARAASFNWFVSNGPTYGSFFITNNGAVNVAGNSPVAVQSGYMARGSLTVGSTDANYGWGSGWNSNTAGLMFECADLTEIAVHDSGHRVASLIAYAGGNGRNTVVLGRDMGWGAGQVETFSTLSVAGSSGYARLNIYNPDGTYTHWGTSERVNYVRGGKTLFDTTTDTYWHLNWYYDAYSPGAHLHNNPGTWSVSIWATGAIVTNYWFGTVSDRRIKKNIKPVGSMLDVIKRIEVVSFDFIDSNNKRDECGVIAQQVEEVFPNIVDKSVGVVPNILKRASSYEKGEGTLTVFYPRQATDELEVGSRVKLMFGTVGATEADSKKKGEYTEKILQVEPGYIVIEWTHTDELEGLSLLVYGKEVEDFRNVDKEQFGVMAIKGIQELYEQMDALSSRIGVLEAREVMWEQHARQQEATIKEQEERLKKAEANLEKVASLLSQMMKA